MDTGGLQSASNGVEEQKKSKKIIIYAVIVIAVIGVAYWLISPLFITKKVNETMEDIGVPVEQIEILSEGSFTGTGGHQGNGTALLLSADEQNFIRFDSDFSVTNGPDLLVYLGADGKYDSAAKLGDLKGSQGGQNYKIPSTIDINKYNEVWVYCRAFSVPFAVAELKL